MSSYLEVTIAGQEYHVERSENKWTWRRPGVDDTWHDANEPMTIAIQNAIIEQHGNASLPWYEDFDESTSI